MSLAFKLALSPLLVAQALHVRRRAPHLPEAAGPRQGVAGRASGRPLRLVVTGDSSAAGVGVATQADALAPQLAAAVAQACDARVPWRLLARSGVSSAEALALLRENEPLGADVVVVLTGVNDVTAQVPSQQAVAARAALANWLRNTQGVQHVVFAPLPPMHHFPGLPQPLRWVAGCDAARHNAALMRWAATRGDVSCVEMEMPLNRGVLASDGFHPGAAAYRYCAHAIAQHVAGVVWPRLALA